MTRATVHHPVAIEFHAPGASGRVELVWDLSARAGRALAERRGLAPDRVVAVALRVAPEHARERAVVSTEALTESGARHTLDPGHGRNARWEREGDLEHIDIEGVLRCTLRHGEVARALYAATPLLAALGIAPGAYSLRPHAPSL